MIKKNDKFLQRKREKEDEKEKERQTKREGGKWDKSGFEKEKEGEW